MSKIRRLSERLIKWCKDRDRSTFLKEEIVKHFSILERDLDVLIDFMFLQGNAIRFQEQRENVTIEFIKFKTSPDAELLIKPEDSAIVTLTSTISEIDAKIQELTETRGFLHEKVLTELRLQNKINAKHFLMRRKMVDKKIEVLLGSRLNIEEQLLSLTSSVANKSIINALKITNNVLKNLTPDMKIVTEIIDTSKDNLENHKEISDMLVDTFDDSNNEELLQEFENLGENQIPSVPTYKIQGKTQEKVVFEEKTEYVLNS